ncbi:MULE domain-containing protein [Aphis craccivora]|uniref:MULE domain-containing protein n=1 Tax=Aphis craccivora TaxID=307492 RepID=A0A6G0ZJZ2_APHCR|nr:MULE domain-containing protein [Aphis craccivora]
MLNDHNHDVIAENIVGRQIINSRIKRKCKNDLLTRPNKIILAVLQNSENDIELVHSDVRLWRKSMYDFRRKSMPKIPKSVEESNVQIFDRRENIISNTGELFCHMEINSSPVMFTFATNLEILSRSSHIFADGTFSHSPKDYEQLYTIHILQNGFYIPIVYCFFTLNSTQTYIDMWLTIVELCLKLTGINLQLSLTQSTFHFDFEKKYT